MANILTNTAQIAQETN